MTTTQPDIRPFDESALQEAAVLLASRHQRDLDRMPLLPERFTEEPAAADALAALWPGERVSGSAAWQGSQLIGFLLGEVRIDTLRGRHVWMPLHGHALAEGQSADLYTDLYSAAGPEWLHWGAFDHYAMMPATDADALAAWFSLSFGQEQAHGLRSLTDTLPQERSLPDIQIRLASQRDKESLVDELSMVLREHMAMAPVWGAALPEHVQPIREGFAELVDDDDVHVWLALENGRLLGYQVYMPAETSRDNLIVPEGCILLEVAATLPAARGRGVGTALTAQGLAYAREMGFTTCLLDWRTTNREARRFWTRAGFKPVASRLIRRVDARIAWAGVPDPIAY